MDEKNDFDYEATDAKLRLRREIERERAAYLQRGGKITRREKDGTIRLLGLDANGNLVQVS